MEHAGRLFVAFIESVVVGFITSRYLNCLIYFILKAFTPKTSIYYNSLSHASLWIVLSGGGIGEDWNHGSCV